jgi:hypothetical protein
MKRVIRLTESDLTRIVRRVLKEEDYSTLVTAFNTAFKNQYRIEMSENISEIRGRGEGAATVAEYNCTSNKLQSKTTGYVDQMLPYLQRMCKVTM